jgi:hypothetical protein
MRKNISKKMVAFSVTVFVLGFFTSWNTSLRHMIQAGIFIPAVHAEDDENEREHESEEDDDYTPTTSTTSSTTTTTTKTKSTPTYKTVLVEKVITTLDPIFTSDQDQDGIVDGLDPHPTVHEREYFTDEDNDGIANAFDMHQGEDDFTFYEQENDANGNGILDSYESLD